MTLEVETPEPPDLTNRGYPNGFEDVDAVGSESDFRRDELEAALRDGAWTDAFEEWAEHTDLAESEFRLVEDLGLVQQFDFYWDPSDARLRFTAPDVPDDWRRRVGDDPPVSGAVASIVDAELADLGRTVVDTLADAYLDWDDAEPSDLLWDGETFGEETGPDE